MGSFAVKCVPLTVMTFGFMMRNSLTFRPQSSIQRFPPQATHLLPVNHQVLVHKIPSITVHASDRFRPGAAAAAAAVGGSSSPTVLNNPYQQPNTVNNVNKNNGWNNDGYCCPCSSCCACRIDMENDKTPSIVDEVTFDPGFDTMDAIGNPLSDFPINSNHHMNDPIRQPFKRPPHPHQSYAMPPSPFNQQQPMSYPTRRRITNRFPHQHPMDPSNRDFGSHGTTLLLPLDQSILPRPSLIWTPIGNDPSFAIPLFAAGNSSRIVRIKKQKLQSTTTTTMPTTDEDD